MFVRVKRSVRDGHAYDYLQLVRSYRDNGRVRQQVLATLGRRDVLVASGQLDGFLVSLSRFSEKIRVVEAVRSRGLQARSARCWGPALVFERLWERQGIPEELSRLAEGRRFRFDVERAAFAMSLQRLCCPGSDLQGGGWVGTVEAEGFEKLELQHFYRTCGFLLDVRQRLERRLYLRDRDLLFMQLNPVFIDTLTYKSLWRVERVFREEKPTLEVRPIFHHRDDTSIGHIVASFLALRLEVDLQHRLDEAGVDISWPDLMRDVGQVQAVTVDLDGQRYRLRTDMVDVAHQAFVATGVGVPSPVTLLGPSPPHAGPEEVAGV